MAFGRALRAARTVRITVLIVDMWITIRTRRAARNSLATRAIVDGPERGERLHPAQIALRARRLGLEGRQVRVVAEIQLERILATIEAEQPAFCVIDSIQTLYSEQLSSAPGSVAQVRECAAQLTRTAKTGGCTIVLVGHVTKEGALAGPRVLEHIVDTVLYFEGDTHSSFRLVRAIKNRFGAVNEIGVFAMTERGLKGVTNPSAIFLSTHGDPVPGACVLVTLEGTRPMLVEIQALVDSGGPSPRRLSVGLDRDRLAMLLAVLHRHAGVACADQDVFVNAVGGVRISEPAADLAVLLAIQSSLRGKPLPRGFIAFGEVGLAGEVRPAPRGQERLKEAAKLGFSVAVVPKANAPKKPIEGLTIHPVERIDEAIALLRTLDRRVDVLGTSLKPGLGGWIANIHCRNQRKCQALAEAGHGARWAYAYTDSLDDLPILRAADKPVIVKGGKAAERRLLRAGLLNGRAAAW